MRHPGEERDGEIEETLTLNEVKSAPLMIMGFVILSVALVFTCVILLVMYPFVAVIRPERFLSGLTSIGESK